MIRKVTYLAAGHRRWPWLLMIGLALAVSVVEALGAVLVFGLLGLVTNPSTPIDLPLVGTLKHPFGNDADTAILRGALLVACFFLLRAVILAGMSYVQARVTQSAGARLASKLHESYLTMPYLSYLGKNSSVQIRNINITVPAVVSDVFVLGTRALSETIVVVALGVVLVLTAPLAMTLLIAVLAPGATLMNRYLRPRLEALGREAQEIAAESLRILQESLQGLREIRVHRREAHFCSAFASTTYSLAQSKTKRTFLRSLPAIGLETTVVFFISSFLVITISSDLERERLLPALGMFTYIGFRLKPSLSQIFEGINALRYSRASVDDLYDDLQHSEAWLTPTTEKAPPISFEKSIDIVNVSFTYPEAPRAALNRISLVIPRGASVGFVGSTGCGKSTLLDLIIGLLDPTKGEVIVDGVDIRVAKSSWLSKLGIVPQTPFLLDASIRKNIALGDEEKAIDETLLGEAMSLAQLSDFVSTLPHGLDTLLGERGIRLSGGQRQRIAIARALYRKPEVLILDEGTAALDNKTEARLIASLTERRGTFTLLMVAHRLSTIRRCDIIHVLSEGKLVGSGSFEDLLKENDHFQDLARSFERHI